MDIAADGCFDERSCEACGSVRSSTGLFPCRWCPQDETSDDELQQMSGRCRSQSELAELLLNNCKGGWQDPKEECPTEADGAPHTRGGDVMILALASLAVSHAVGTS